MPDSQRADSNLVLNCISEFCGVTTQRDTQLDGLKPGGWYLSVRVHVCKRGWLLGQMSHNVKPGVKIRSGHMCSKGRSELACGDDDASLPLQSHPDSG